MPDMIDEFLKSLKVTGQARVLHKPGAVRLDDYPRLVYALAQWGPGVRTEDKGVPVEDIARAVAGGASLDEAVAQFGTTPDHVADAVKYAQATGFLTKEA